MRSRHDVGRPVMALTVALALVLASCGGDDGIGTTTTTATSTTIAVATTAGSTTITERTTTTTQPVDETGSVVYFLLEELDPDSGGPFVVPVYRKAPATGTEPEQVLATLLEGPTRAERDGIPAISTAIPDGTTVLGVTVADGVATVDLSGEYDDGGGSSSMFARLAQVVFTLTRIPDIGAVAFELDGEPVSVFSSEGIELEGPQTRDDYYGLLPPIFVDSPAFGESVTSPVHVTGLSNVFEAVSQVMLTDDDGLALFEGTVVAGCGTGCWGEWQIDVPYSIDREQFGALIVWAHSPKDGSRIDVREYPVQLR